MLLIDIHTHKEVVVGNEKIIIQNINILEDIMKIPLPGVKYSMGVHPWYINKNLEQQFNAMMARLKNNNLIAIGECGLDRSIEINLDLQKEVFIKMVSLSEQYKKPLIIHCVKAYSDLLEIRKHLKITTPWIFHGFNSNEQMAGQLIKSGCYLSFGELLFNENTKAFKAIKSQNLNYLFFETDESHYNIEEIYEQASQVLNISIQDLANQIVKNFKMVYNLE